MKTHISLNVSDVSKSVDFYQKLFSVQPQKSTDRYAKFDVNELKLNFALNQDENLSRVSHLGVEVESKQELEMWTARLHASGLVGRPEEKTNCCYALQDKMWFQDPDGNEWEVFHVIEQLPVTEETNKNSACCA